MDIRILTAGVALAIGLVTTDVVAAPSYPTPGIENPVTYTFTATADADLIAYFAGSTASFTSRIGLLVNGIDTGIRGLQNHDGSFNYLTYGTSLNFGAVTAGDTLTFLLDVDDNAGVTYRSDLMNPDGVNHAYSTIFADDGTIPDGIFVAFEDLFGGGDFNYADHTFVFSNVTAIELPNPNTAIPEPATWAMMIGGFGLVGGAMRRRRMRAVLVLS